MSLTALHGQNEQHTDVVYLSTYLLFLSLQTGEKCLKGNLFTHGLSYQHEMWNPNNNNKISYHYLCLYIKTSVSEILPPCQNHGGEWSLPSKNICFVILMKRSFNMQLFFFPDTSINLSWLWYKVNHWCLLKSANLQRVLWALRQPMQRCFLSC